VNNSFLTNIRILLCMLCLFSISLPFQFEGTKSRSLGVRQELVWSTLDMFDYQVQGGASKLMVEIHTQNL